MMMHYIPEVKRVLNKGDEDLPLEERERKSQEEREDMDYIENFNKEDWIKFDCGGEGAHEVGGEERS